MRKTSLSTGLAVAALVSLGAPAFALPSQANAHAQVAHPSISASPSPGARVEGQERACQNREKAINNIMSRIVERGQKQVTLFGTIAGRVETFATTKGKQPADYDALVAAVTAAGDKATTDLAAVKTDATFSCDSADPKASVSTFQSALKLEIADLKAYKTAVRNLIVGVKSATGAAQASKSPELSPHASASPEPSQSPEQESNQ